MIVDRKITQPEFDKMASPLELDLIAFFKTLEESVLSSTFDGERSPEDLLNEIDSIFYSTNTGSISVEKEDRPTHFRIFQGLMIGIENEKGTTRSGVDPNGYKWSVKMYHDYGYIWNTKAGDGDSIDCYLGPNEDSEKVFVVSQVNPNTKQFDEYKVMLGFGNKHDAMIAYRNQYDSPDFFGGIKEFSLADFKNIILKST